MTTEEREVKAVCDAWGQAMQAMDFVINNERKDRLEVVKQVVGEFVEGRPDDRIGIVVFGAEAGSDLSHIVKTTTYLIDPRYREPVYQEVGKWLKGVFPISTGLVVSALGQPQWLMEIDVIAVIPE